MERRSFGILALAAAVAPILPARPRRGRSPSSWSTAPLSTLRVGGPCTTS
jgi:hypothetical protein